MLKKLFPVLAVGVLVGCAMQPQGQKEPQNKTGMANPASVYCVEKGGRLEIAEGQNGQSGICNLPDGSAIDEWDLFYRDHPHKP